MDRKSLLRLPVRTLVYSHVIPPHASGHSTVLERLFRGIDPDGYRLITFDDIPDSFTNNQAGSPPLPARTRSYSSQWIFSVPSDYRLKRVRYTRLLTTEIAKTARLMAQFCVEEQCQAIIATSGTMPRLPAAALAARLARVPLVLLIWDFWRYQETEPFLRHLVEILEPIVFRSAAAVVAPNELLADSIARLDGVRPVVIRNPIDNAAIEGVRDTLIDRPRSGPWRIVFTGQIYAAMTDAVVNLLTALESPELEDVELHYYGPQSAQELAVIGIKGRIVCHPFIPPPEVYSVQRSADALFLPLAFSGPLKDLIYSSSTSKLADYLASGRPILVHAPPGVFPAWYVRRHGCGLIVDVPDPKVLGQAIQLLQTDSALCRRLGRNGQDRAREDFSAERARRELVRVLEKVAGSA
jgi:glycosyltransferase involved in cell wall biosynthesis